MRLLRSLTALIATFTLLSAACSSGSGSVQSAASSADSPEIVAPAPDWPLDIVAETVDGSSLDTGDFAGTDLVLWFWAPW